MKKIILFLLIFLSLSSNKQNTFKQYEEVISLFDSFNFNNDIKVDYELDINYPSAIFEIDSVYVNYEGVSYLKVIGDNSFESYYFDEILRINNNEVIFKKVLSNAYRNYLMKYVHLNFNRIEMNDIKSVTKKDDGFEIVLNDDGSLYYFNDLLNRQGLNIEKGDFIGGEVKMVISKNEFNNLNVSGTLEYKGGIISVKEVMQLSIVDQIEIEDWAY